MEENSFMDSIYNFEVVDEWSVSDKSDCSNDGFCIKDCPQARKEKPTEGEIDEFLENVKELVTCASSGCIDGLDSIEPTEIGNISHEDCDNLSQSNDSKLSVSNITRSVDLKENKFICTIDNNSRSHRSSVSYKPDGALIKTIFHEPSVSINASSEPIISSGEIDVPFDNTAPALSHCIDDNILHNRDIKVIRDPSENSRVRTSEQYDLGYSERICVSRSRLGSSSAEDISRCSENMKHERLVYKTLECWREEDDDRGEINQRSVCIGDREIEILEVESHHVTRSRRRRSMEYRRRRNEGRILSPSSRRRNSVLRSIEKRERGSCSSISITRSDRSSIGRSSVSFTSARKKSSLLRSVEKKIRNVDEMGDTRMARSQSKLNLSRYAERRIKTAERQGNFIKQSKSLERGRKRRSASLSREGHRSDRRRRRSFNRGRRLMRSRITERSGVGYRERRYNRSRDRRRIDRSNSRKIRGRRRSRSPRSMSYISLSPSPVRLGTELIESQPTIEKTMMGAPFYGSASVPYTQAHCHAGNTYPMDPGSGNQYSAMQGCTIKYPNSGCEDPGFGGTDSKNYPGWGGMAPVYPSQQSYSSYYPNTAHPPPHPWGAPPYANIPPRSTLSQGTWSHAPPPTVDLSKCRGDVQNTQGTGAKRPRSRSKSRDSTRIHKRKSKKRSRSRDKSRKRSRSRGSSHKPSRSRDSPKLHSRSPAGFREECKGVPFYPGTAAKYKDSSFLVIDPHKIPSPPPPPVLSHAKKMYDNKEIKKGKSDYKAGQIAASNRKEHDGGSVSLSSLLEAVMETSGVGSRRKSLCDPQVKKEILSNCEKNILQLFKKRTAPPGAFIPDPVGPYKVNIKCSPLALFHPHLTFNGGPVSTVWKCPHIVVPSVKMVDPSLINPKAFLETALKQIKHEPDNAQKIPQTEINVSSTNLRGPSEYQAAVTTVPRSSYSVVQGSHSGFNSSMTWPMSGNNMVDLTNKPPVTYPQYNANTWQNSYIQPYMWNEDYQKPPPLVTYPPSQFSGAPVPPNVYGAPYFSKPDNVSYPINYTKTTVNERERSPKRKSHFLENIPVINSDGDKKEVFNKVDILTTPDIEVVKKNSNLGENANKKLQRKFRDLRRTDSLQSNKDCSSSARSSSELSRDTDLRDLILKSQYESKGDSFHRIPLSRRGSRSPSSKKEHSELRRDRDMSRRSNNETICTSHGYSSDAREDRESDNRSALRTTTDCGRYRERCRSNMNDVDVIRISSDEEESESGVKKSSRNISSNEKGLTFYEICYLGKDLRSIQEKSPMYNSIIESLQKGESKYRKLYLFRNSVLCKTASSKELKNMRIVIPRDYIKEFIVLIHKKFHEVCPEDLLSCVMQFVYPAGFKTPVNKIISKAISECSVCKHTKLPHKVEPLVDKKTDSKPPARREKKLENARFKQKHLMSEEDFSDTDGNTLKKDDSSSYVSNISKYDFKRDDKTLDGRPSGYEKATKSKPLSFIKQRSQSDNPVNEIVPSNDIPLTFSNRPSHLNDKHPDKESGSKVLFVTNDICCPTDFPKSGNETDTHRKFEDAIDRNEDSRKSTALSSTSDSQVSDGKNAISPDSPNCETINKSKNKDIIVCKQANATIPENDEDDTNSKRTRNSSTVPLSCIDAGSKCMLSNAHRTKDVILNEENETKVTIIKNVLSSKDQTNESQSCLSPLKNNNADSECMPSKSKDGSISGTDQHVTQLSASNKEREKERQPDSVPVNTNDSGLDFKGRIRQVQKRNKVYGDIISQLESSKIGEGSDYVLKGGMLCKKFTAEGGTDIRILAPPEDIEDIVNIVHSMSAVHIPPVKMVTFFSKHFSPIENLDSKINEYVDKCAICEKQ